MKCIKRGTLPQERIWTGTCNNCRSIYEALEGELTIENDIRENYSFARAKCELCKYDFFLYPQTKSLKSYDAQDYYNK
jgi:hypothetical protein